MHGDISNHNEGEIDDAVNIADVTPVSSPISHFFKKMFTAQSRS